MNSNIQIRPIEQKDNIDIAKVIRGALEEFGANKPGTVYFDPTTDALFELFNTPGSYYYIATIDNKVVGGAGIFPTENLPKGTCELVKLYLHKDARGTGLGKQLLNTAMQWAKENGYTQVYLESMPELSKA
ncbi:MAG: GNAT family N-acetyltransferase, partial [Sediminibacterium sp.]